MPCSGRHGTEKLAGNGMHLGQNVAAGSDHRRIRQRTQPRITAALPQNGHLGLASAVCGLHESQVERPASRGRVDGAMRVSWRMILSRPPTRDRGNPTTRGPPVSQSPAHRPPIRSGVPVRSSLVRAPRGRASREMPERRPYQRLLGPRSLLVLRIAQATVGLVQCYQGGFDIRAALPSPSTVGDHRGAPRHQ